MADGIVWTSDTLTPGLMKFPVEVDRAVTEAVEFFSPRVEAAAKIGAPWTDQTGNARNGLSAQTGHVPGVMHWIELSHSLPYGIWLEIRWNGKYAIIVPTIKKQGVELMAALKTIFSRIRAV